ncbi:hypothetical protein ACLOJK_030161 [Asimina triloba]
MIERNVVVWTLMITRLTQCGFAKDVVDLFIEMEVSGFIPDQFALSRVISACTELGIIQPGQHLHSHAILAGLISVASVGCSLVNMYVNCAVDGSVDASMRVFDQMLMHDVMSWTAIITGYVQMLEISHEAMKPNCTNVRDIQIFRQVSKVCPVASSHSSVDDQNVYSRLSQSRTANSHTHLCLSSSPSTLRIQTHFSRTERRMGLVPPSLLSRGSSLPILEEKKDGGRIQSDQGGEFLGFGKEPCNSAEPSCISLEDSISLDEIGCSNDSSFTTWISPANSYITATSWAESSSSSTWAIDEQSESPSVLLVGDGGSAGARASPLGKSKSERVESRREGLSEKLKKRVRFRLPEEADIRIYDAVEDEEFEC